MPETQQKKKVPFDPIQLTRYGDSLTSTKNTVTHTDEDQIPCGKSCCMGMHERCSGKLHCEKISDTYCVINCDLCNLHVYFPAIIKTYLQLREYFQQKFNSNSQD